MLANSRPIAQQIRKESFILKARELLPTSSAEVFTRANLLFGEDVLGKQVDGLRERITRRARFWGAMAEAYKWELERGECPDGKFEPRLVEVLREARGLGLAVDAIPLTAEGIALRWNSGGYSVVRSALLPSGTDDGRVGMLVIDRQLVTHGGLFVVRGLANGYKLQPFSSVMAAWKVLLRMRRKLKPLAWSEVRRRWKAGQRMTYEEAGRYSYRAVLNPGRMPPAVRASFQRHVATFNARLARVDDYVRARQSEGAALAEEFARAPGVREKEQENLLRNAIEELNAAGAVVMAHWGECCIKATVPAHWPETMPFEKPIRKRGLSHSARRRLSFAEERFQSAMVKAHELGAQPATVATAPVDRAGQQLLFA